MALVCFRVDASSSIGLGHLMRCLALAQALSQQNIQCVFFIRSGSAEYCKARHDWVGQLKLIPDDISLEQENQWLQQELKLLQPWALVLDGYQFNQEYRADLARFGIPLVLFDDNNDSGQLYADMVLNASSNAQSLGYEQTAGNAILCLGDNYRILRQEFIHKPDIHWQQRNSLTLIFGGSDVLGLTLPLLNALQQRGVDFPIRVITGAAYPHTEQLVEFVRSSALPIQHLPDCQQVAEVFSYSRLVVSAAGGSQFELLACETPAVLVAVAANQLNATKQAAQQGWCEWQDCTAGLKVDALATQVLELWRDEIHLKYMSQQAEKFADLAGADRVVAAIATLGEKV